jgi:predicted transcriptional regulator
MSPIDYRTATWADIRGRLVNLRASVYDALLDHGPCTTRELATACGIDLLTVRPRVTELVQLGLVRCIGGAGHHGIYQALTLAQAEDHFLATQSAALEPQLCLAI